MKKNIGMIFLAAFLFLNVAGCAPLLVGAAIGGVAMYAVGKDTIYGDSDKPYDNLWDSAVSVATAKGTIKQQDKLGGYIYVEGASGRVWIRLIKLTRTTTRIKVSARKMRMPDLNQAQDVFGKILNSAA